MPNEWVEICIRAELDAGELLAHLEDPAVQGAWEDGGTVHLYWPDTQWNADRLAALRRVLADLPAARGSDVPIQINQVPYQDWNAEWARSVKPLRIGRVVIRPSWEAGTLQPGDVEIILDPKQAFGTGHHATTRMLLEWLQEELPRGARVLDVGTGSGILAMAAVKWGAVHAVGVECDAVAASCAAEAVRNNRLQASVDLVCGTVDALAPRSVPPFDVVLANIDRMTLLSLADRLAVYAHAGARLVLSGILTEQQADISSRFADAGLSCIRRRECDGWMALELVRAESCEGGDGCP